MSPVVRLLSLLLLLSTSSRANVTYVDLLVSSLVRTGEIGELKLLWYTETYEAGDRLVLERGGEPVFEYLLGSSQGSGSIRTSVFLGDPEELNSPPLRTRCSIYSTSYRRQNQTLAHSCLQNWPTWMNDLRGQIENLSLADLFIPGTHISASYITSKTGYFDNILQKYVYTQDISVYEQLVMGVRYLDLRVAYYNHSLLEGEGGGSFAWWCNHDFVPIQPLGKILKQIREFLTATNEIVIVDFHNFPVGFKNEETHKRLGEFILGEVGELVQRGSSQETKSLREIWDSGRRLVVAYNRLQTAQDFSFCRPVRQSWGNKQTLSDLHGYIDTLVQDCSELGQRGEGGLWSAMAELTPTTLGVLTDWYGGLRHLAERVNTNLTLSYRFQRAWAGCSNIVAVDFIRGSALVRAAVAANRERALLFSQIRTDPSPTSDSQT